MLAIVYTKKQRDLFPQDIIKMKENANRDFVDRQAIEVEISN